MERTGNAAGIYRGKALPANPAPESLTKRVLVGAWDATKKIVESQSPQAWNERIINVINRQIIPKLSPEQTQWVAKHHRMIETGARVAGSALSTAEIMAAVAILRAGLLKAKRMWEPTAVKLKYRKYQRMRKMPAAKPVPLSEFDTLVQRQYGEPPATTMVVNYVAEAYEAVHGHNMPEIRRIEETMRNLIADASGIFGKGNPRFETALHLALSKRKNEARDILKSRFVNAYVKALDLPFTPDRSKNGANLLLAGQAFRRWEDTQFRGLEYIFGLSQHHPDVGPNITEKAAIKLGGRRIPLTFRELLSAYPSTLPVENVVDMSINPPGMRPNAQGGLDFDYLEKELSAEEKLRRMQTRARKELNRRHIWSREQIPESTRFMKVGDKFQQVPPPEPALTLEQRVDQAFDDSLRQFKKERQDRIDHIHEVVSHTPSREQDVKSRVRKALHRLRKAGDRLRASVQRQPSKLRGITEKRNPPYITDPDLTRAERGAVAQAANRQFQKVRALEGSMNAETQAELKARATAKAERRAYKAAYEARKQARDKAYAEERRAYKAAQEAKNQAIHAAKITEAERMLREIAAKGKQREWMRLTHTIEPTTAAILSKADYLLEHRSDETVGRLINELRTLPDRTTPERIEKTRAALELFHYVVDISPDIQKELGRGTALEGVLSARAGDWVAKHTPGLDIIEK